MSNRVEQVAILRDANGRDVHISQGTSYSITMTLRDEAGAVMPVASVNKLVMTLYARDDAARTIINARDHVNILNSPPGTMDALGVLIVALTPLDNAMVDLTAVKEWHRLLIEGTYGGTKKVKGEIDFIVKAVPRNTAV